MKKIFLSLAIFVMAVCASAQTNQYFWYQGNLMMGNPIAQIDSVTFGTEDTDSILVYLPRTIIKTVHDTMYVTVHDTIKPNTEGDKTIYKGHEYVDLGLPSGLLWATCNVGADIPEQIGGNFAWGETQTKASYTSTTYAYENNPISLSNIAATVYDAAHTIWGGEWRMPTKQECDDLLTYCTTKDTTINGIDGKLVIGSNNNRIFVPAGYFWTSTSYGTAYAYRMYEWTYISFSQRWVGFPIRPVVSKTDDVISQTETIPGAQIVHDTVYVTIHDTICPNDDLLNNDVMQGEFSVSETKKVHFSKGNLQATTTDLGANWTWSFAANQWDFIADSSANVSINGNGTVSTNGTVDLFCWSTSTTYYGIHNSTNLSTYYTGDFVDWGITIGEGWRTLSKSEWVYLFFGRTNASKLFGLGSMNGVYGLILLPDDWSGEKFSDTENGLVDRGDYYYYNENCTVFHTYTIEQWSAMEKQGAIFLPMAGLRNGTVFGATGGNYWSSTRYATYNAYLLFVSCNLNPQDKAKHGTGLSVRLVQDVE